MRCLANSTISYQESNHKRYICLIKICFKMEEKNKNEELQSRREFFKKTAQNVLPFLGVVALSPLLTSCDPDDDEEMDKLGCKGCSGYCDSSCSGSCDEDCTDICAFGCTGTCDGHTRSW